MKLKEFRTIIETLESIHSDVCSGSNNPRDTARRFIQAVGSDTAAQCVAIMVRRLHWDGRISRSAKARAEGVELSADWERRIDDAYTSIHAAHLSQIAEAMPKELEFVQAESEDEPKTEQNITLTVSPTDARLILRAIKARANHWSHPDQVNRTSNAFGIRRMYQEVAAIVQHQMASQGVNP
ncbi:hypothetical protein [Pseudoflavonifractor phocaeensis]|uniref:hypothetical protein n=1 Tax=Pseudoflavonifractor phocaeensis TaxID=1870988 RepID=UPI0019562600|nr:hypothetical protein [Pseudoflavonifractor phocaeensis]MBM6924544.1 hypothetical protein [Pseudoflavonifractor phocaeensis]